MSFRRTWEQTQLWSCVLFKSTSVPSMCQALGTQKAPISKDISAQQWRQRQYMDQCDQQQKKGQDRNILKQRVSACVGGQGSGQLPTAPVRTRGLQPERPGQTVGCNIGEDNKTQSIQRHRGDEKSGAFRQTQVSYKSTIFPRKQAQHEGIWPMFMTTETNRMTFLIL